MSNPFIDTGALSAGLADAAADRRKREAEKVEQAAAERARANAKTLQQSQKAARLKRDAKVLEIHNSAYRAGQIEQERIERGK